MATPLDEQVAELNRRIDELKRQAEQAEREASHHAQRLLRLRLRESYLRAAIWLRTAGGEFEHWRIAVLGVVPLVAASIFFLFVALVSDRLGWGIILALPVWLITAVIVAQMLGRDGTEALMEQLASVRMDRQEAREQRSTRRGAKAAALGQLQDVLARRSELIASHKFRREQLLKRDWQQLRGADWQNYLCDVLAAHGASVDVVRRGSNPDPDVIASFGGRRIAIQARGRDHTINNVTVQQAVDSMAHYRCHGCAVITNQRITGSARELAKHHGCQLVGEHNFASWLRGDWQL